MTAEIPQIKTTLQNALHMGVTTLFRDYNGTLQRLQEISVLGGHTWKSKDVVSYTYFFAGRNRTSEEWSDENRRRRTTTVSDTVIRHEHQLFNADYYPLSAPIRRPDYVNYLTDAIAPWLQPHALIIEGDMLREKVTTTTTVVSETVHEEVFPQFQWSPALVLGKYVLTGWSQKDLRPEDALDVVARKITQILW